MALLVLVAVLAVACAAATVYALRVRRERETAQAMLYTRVPAFELAAALASRDALLEAAPLPMMLFEQGTVAARVNRAARRTFAGAGPGTDAEEIGAALAVAVRHAVATGEAVDHQVVLDKPDRRTFEAHVRAHSDGDGGRHAAAVLVDVTGSVDFREARRLFSAAVSHELRTPLARILGLAETMALPQSDQEREALVAQTEVEIDNMRRLVDEMLLLASLDRGSDAIREGVTDAGRVAEAVVLDRQSRRAQRDRELDVRAGNDLWVPVAPRLLEVVIGNLVDNALRHAGPDAAVTLLVQPLAAEVEIVVADTGVGIPPEHLPHVFERFYRGEASRSGPGSGLGLAIVKHVVEAHDGEVAVESRPGHGTSVRLVLPRAAPRGRPAQPSTARASKR